MATSLDPREIFRAAEQFNAAGAVLVRPLDLALPLSVTHAFALELYLKSLLVIETGVPARGHDLLTLFQQLPEGHKQRSKPSSLRKNYRPVDSCLRRSSCRSVTAKTLH